MEKRRRWQQKGAGVGFARLGAAGEYNKDPAIAGRHWGPPFPEAPTQTGIAQEHKTHARPRTSEASRPDTAVEHLVWYPVLHGINVPLSSPRYNLGLRVLGPAIPVLKQLNSDIAARCWRH